MTYDLKSGVTVFNTELSKVLFVGSEGLTETDLDLFGEYSAGLKSGDVDTITLIPNEGVEVDEDLNLKVFAQIHAQIESLVHQIRLAITATGSNYTGLHMDGGVDALGNEIKESGVRVNFNSGVYDEHRSNIPSSVDPREFEPFFVFGRENVSPEAGSGLVRSFEHFAPTVVVSMEGQVWNIFRNLGDRDGKNPPVTHAVIPRKLAEVILDPHADFQPLHEIETEQAYPNGPKKTKLVQGVSLDGETTDIGTYSDTPYVDSDGNDIGFSRVIRAVDYVDKSVAIDPL